MLLASCVRMEPYYKDLATKSVLKAEQAVAAREYEAAQREARATYRTFIDAKPRDKHLNDLAKGEQELWGRLTGIETSLDAASEAAPRVLVELAKQGDAEGLERLARLVQQRTLNNGLDHPRKAQYLAAMQAACPAAVEAAALGGTLKATARALDKACDSEMAALALALSPGRRSCGSVSRSLELARLPRVSEGLRRFAVTNAKDCAFELEQFPERAGRVARENELAFAREALTHLTALGVAPDTEPRAALERATSSFEAQLTQLKAKEDEEKAAADAEKKRKLELARVELEKAAAAKDKPKACALVKEHGLPVPEVFRGEELAARAVWDAHAKQAANESWPAAAWVHALWLKSSGEKYVSAPAVARAWDEPTPYLALNWRDFSASDDCFPWESRSQNTGTWRVLDVRCNADAGRLVKEDILETYRVRNRRLRYDGREEIVETTFMKKVGERTSRLNAQQALVTIGVEAPVGHLKLGLFAMGTVQNTQAEYEQGFLFSLRGGGKKGVAPYDLLAELSKQYRAELDRLKADWRAAAQKKGAPEEEREEAFARLALLGDDAEALAYFRQRYGVTGRNVRTMSLPPIPNPCP